MLWQGGWDEIGNASSGLNILVLIILSEFGWIHQVDDFGVESDWSYVGHFSSGFMGCDLLIEMYNFNIYLLLCITLTLMSVFKHGCVFFYNLNVSQAWTPMIVAKLLIPSFWWSHQIFSLWLCHPKDNMNPSMSPNLHHMKVFFFVLSACAWFPFYDFKLNDPFYPC